MEIRIINIAKYILSQFRSPKINEWFDKVILKILQDMNIPNLNDIAKILQRHKSLIKNPGISININDDLRKFAIDVGNTFTSILEKRSRQEKSNLGQIFTPFSIIDIIFKQIHSIKENFMDVSILDFASGTGNFCVSLLVKKFEKLSLNLLNIQNQDEKLDIIENFLRNQRNLIYSTDIDSISFLSSNIFIIILSIKFLNFHKIPLLSSILDKIPPISLLHQDFLNINSHLPEYSPEIIIGNPPYVFMRDLDDKTLEIIKSKHFLCSVGQYDLSDIFIEQSLRILNSGGIIGIIIPETLLILENRKELRRIIINESKKIMIIEVSDIFKNTHIENVLLFLEKNSNNDDVDIIKIEWNGNAGEIFSKKELLNTPNIPLIPYSPSAKRIITWIQENYLSINEWNLLKPRKMIMVFRGVEISKSGTVMRCQNCQKWMPYSKKRENCIHCNVVLDVHKNQHSIIIPSNNDKGNILDKSRRFIQTIPADNEKEIQTAKIHLNYLGINYKKLENYCPNRIIVRQLLAKKKICARICMDDSLTSQSIYNIILPDNLINSTEYLLKNLTSDYISYYNYITFSRGKRLFSRILLEKLKNLPWIPKKMNVLNKKMDLELEKEILRVLK